MTNIIVNIADPRYTEVTSKKELGLGTPFSQPDTAYEILVSELSLLTKLQNLKNVRKYFDEFTTAKLLASRISGESFESSVILTFKAKLRDALFIETQPSIVAGNNVRSFYPYSTRFVSPDTPTAAAEYVVAIADGWISLFEQIINLTEGLSREEIEDIPVDDGDASTILTYVEVEESRTDEIWGTLTINFSTLNWPLRTALYSAATDLVKLKTAQFFDESRELKTILNLGDDKQYVVEAWRPTQDKNTIQIKLLEPLDSVINQYDSAYIVREAVSSIIDTINVELPPLVDTTPFLRPRNNEVGRFNTNQQILNDTTITSLNILTGSIGTISASTVSYEDRTFNRWYTADFKSSELNVDFTDYNNFIHFGSAEARILAFQNKLLSIEQLGISASISSSNAGERKRAIEIESIKRNFDPFEQFLYYETTASYSASAFYADLGYEYNATGSWPKNSSSLPISPTSTVVSVSWLPIQQAIAVRYDQNNPNYLIRHIPLHIQEDEESAEYATFIQLFGHFLDNIKIYIDQFPHIYSTSPNPTDELSMDQVYEVATSLGLKLPNAYALETLQDFIVETYGETGTRELVAETWKRFLHSAVFLLKSKGTKTSADSLLNVYGLRSLIVQTKETSYPSQDNYIQSDESVYGLRFTTASAARIQLPFVSSSFSASSVQIRFIPSVIQTSSLLTGDNKWAIDLIPHPSASKITYGRIHIVSGSGRTILATSSYFPLFSTDYTNIMLRSASTDITIIQSDGDQLLYQASMSVGWGSLWNSTTNLYIGGSGSIKLSSNFDGIVDEVRAWNVNINDALFIKQAYDPGSLYGAGYTSSYANLYARASFSEPSASITQLVVNETPFASPPQIPATGFTTASFERLTRPIKQFVPSAGAVVYSNKKISVATPPTFTALSVDEDGVRTLSRTNSIKSVDSKRHTSGHNIVSFAISPIDFINQNIIRTMGILDINSIIGSPRKLTKERYTEVDTLYKFYLEHYNETVNPNEYIRFFSNIVKGPSEQIEDMIPARTKLLNGVVIESHVLDRKRTYIQKDFTVDGTGTEKFINFLTGSEINHSVGAYSFEADYELYPAVDTISIPSNKAIPQYIGTSLVTSSLLSNGSGIANVDSTIDAQYMGPKNSTLEQNMSPAKKYTQTLGVISGTSSFADSNSSVSYIESIVDITHTIISSSGYPRNPFLGILSSGSISARLESENNTVDPFYSISPRSDFFDVGTTTYFTNSAGIYKFKSRTSNYSSEEYLALFNVSLASPIDQLYANITLLPTDEVDGAPGRYSVSIPIQMYGAGVASTGTIKLANIFSLIGVEGAVGLQIQLYDSTNGIKVFDGTLDGVSDILPYLLIQTNNYTVNYTITNGTAADILSVITFTYFAYEAASLKPRGYLPRHYRFSRGTGEAQRRRNYLGCRQVFCPDGCPPGTTETETVSPVQISLATRTNPIVNNPTRQSPTNSDPFTLGENDVIRFGGSGPLIE